MHLDHCAQVRWDCSAQVYAPRSAAASEQGSLERTLERPRPCGASYPCTSCPALICFSLNSTRSPCGAAAVSRACSYLYSHHIGSTSRSALQTRKRTTARPACRARGDPPRLREWPCVRGLRLVCATAPIPRGGGSSFSWGARARPGPRDALALICTRRKVRCRRAA
ncbi:hypothetical protein B0H17DRAFT_587840 [Mycena rosella]|uniref:Uncharacterized protein n=1 Tax=Mycena rosella TaxID=1033263 RepID=A0AAD7BKQ3_MYCRO|nr:hypothetical protein B0H17DRAFT_587840 [Mycena rosella]